MPDNNNTDLTGRATVVFYPTKSPDTDSNASKLPKVRHIASYKLKAIRKRGRTFWQSTKE